MTILIILLVAIILMSWALAIGLYKNLRVEQTQRVIDKLLIDRLNSDCGTLTEQVSERDAQLRALIKVLPKTKKVSDYLLK